MSVLRRFLVQLQFYQFNLFNCLMILLDIISQYHTLYQSMDSFSRENLYEKIQWVKEKGSWLMLTLTATVFIFFAAFWFTLFVLFVMQPEPYAVTDIPEFQAKRRNDLKLFSVFQNLDMKPQFCNQDRFTYAGSSVGQEEFCSFNYQKLPKLNGPFDVSLHGLNSMEVRYASVCVLRRPKVRKTLQIYKNESQLQDAYAHPRYRYVCQKYRAYKSFQIANRLDDNELVFVEIELELTDKGYDSFDGADIKLSFEEHATRVQRLVIDYYWILAVLLALGVAIWVALLIFVVGITIIVRKILSEKQEQELRRIHQVASHLKRD